MSSKKKPVKTENITVSPKYCVSIPQKELLDFFKLNCTGEIMKLSKEFRKWSPGQVFAKLLELGEVFNTTISILNIIQSAWLGIEDYVKKQKSLDSTECGSCKKKGLCEAEKRVVRALRKQGLSIKAIGKEIHRAEKVVADFVKTLPKK